MILPKIETKSAAQFIITSKRSLRLHSNAHCKRTKSVEDDCICFVKIKEEKTDQWNREMVLYCSKSFEWMLKTFARWFSYGMAPKFQLLYSTFQRSYILFCALIYRFSSLLNFFRFFFLSNKHESLYVN